MAHRKQDTYHRTDFAESLWSSCNKPLWSRSHHMRQSGRQSAVTAPDSKAAEAGFAFTPKYDATGLVSAIVQDAVTGEVLMFAFMNREALQKTAELGRAVYFSRSRGRLWFKGEESGHRQKVLGIYLDCDEDVLLLEIEQEGGIACHTGRESCFYRQLQNGQWQSVEPVLKDPKAIYPKS